MLPLTLLTLVGGFSFATARYVLQDDYDSNSFFSMFDFFTGNDPTRGYVNYVDRGQAQSQGLIGQRNGATYIGVDNTNVADGRGRNSVRLSSKKTYTHGLIVLDLEHMPGGQCGSWPAFWTFGPNWPNSGEIDIIEGVNSQTANKVALHTSAGCTVNNDGAFSGQLITPNCDVNAPGQWTNAGCQISSSDSASYGTGFNANGGGVYATEWTSNAISVYFFPRGAIPDDLSGGNPNPSGWGRPMAKFQGACDIDDKFRDHNIIFDVTFCGDWAGNVWAQDPVCSSRAPSCQAYVQNNPAAFTDAYWQVNSLKIYKSREQIHNNVISDESAVSSAVASSESVSSAVASSESVSSAVASSESVSSAVASSESVSSAVASSQPVSSAVVSPEPSSSAAPLPTETTTPITTTTTTPAEQLISITPPTSPALTSTPSPTTLATTTQRRGRYRTVSAMRWDQFGRSRDGRPTAAKQQRSQDPRHLLRQNQHQHQHQHRAHV